MAYTTNQGNNIRPSRTPGKEVDPNVTGTTQGVGNKDSLNIPSISSKIIDRTFGRKGDYIELHIYNVSNELIHSDYNFSNFTIPNDSKGASKSITVNPKEILNKIGYSTGQYVLHLNILKNKIFDTEDRPFKLKQVSNSRRELRTVAHKATNEILNPAIGEFISDIESAAYFKEFSLNFGNDILIPCINVLLDRSKTKYQVLFKTLHTFPNSIQIDNSFKVVEEISDPVVMNIDLGDPAITDNTISLSPPNFRINVRQESSMPSSLKSYDDILSYNLTSSYQHLLSKLGTDGLNIDIDYTYIRPVSESSLDQAYHFDSFVHFGSATERLKNFEYKLKLIEHHNEELSTINDIPLSTSESVVVLTNKENHNQEIQNIIKGFDGYEQFLYFTSGTYAWPKIESTPPYSLYSITSSEAKEWLGDERGGHPNYGGQLLSASLFDNYNPYNLHKLLPAHITDNNDNQFYSTFLNMIGQHFDYIWIYINALGEIYNADNKRGISKDLVYHQLKSIGMATFDQFENSDLVEYFLGGDGISGSINYNVKHYYNYSDAHPSSSLGLGLSVSSSETLVTASNDVSIPKQDITKEIWKRLYHNAPYLFKTKGTERGLKALMACYGIPTTILNIKEYGGSTTTTGPMKDLDFSEYYKTFSYEKQAYALSGNSKETGYFFRANWSSSITNNMSSSAKTVEFRIKPVRNGSNKLHLFSLAQSTPGIAAYPSQDRHLLLEPWTGGDISSSGDASQYGRLSAMRYNDSQVDNVYTRYFPVFNGDWWNIHIGIKETKPNGGDASIPLQIGAYQANFNKHIDYAVTSENVVANNFLRHSWGYYYGQDTSTAAGKAKLAGARYCYIGGKEPDNNDDMFDEPIYSGSIQEIRFHFGELLSHETLKKHALEPFMYSGNTISSSYENIVFRAPYGSNNQVPIEGGSYHPNQNIDYLGTCSIAPTSVTTATSYTETHHLPTPDTVGISTTSEKVRIDNGTVDDNFLSPTLKGETSTLDRQPLDYEDLGVFFSPTDQINEDILYTLGSFRMDDYIGSPLPSAQTASKYDDLKTIKDLYFRKVERKYNYWDYIKLIQNIDHTLFKMIEQWVPARANLKTGLLIEPHFLERSKMARSLPVRSDAQTMITGSHQTFETKIKTHFPNSLQYQIRSSSAKDFGQEGVKDNIKGQWDPGSYVVYHSNPHRFLTSSKGSYHRLDQGTNATIGVYDDYMDPSRRDPNEENNMDCQAPIKPFDSVTGKPGDYVAHKSSVLLGNAPTGRKSNIYYKYKEYLESPSNSSSVYLG